MFRRLIRVLFILVILIQLTLVQARSLTLVPSGSVWRYHADGSAPGEEWLDPDFRANRWELGRAELGYGDGGERTVLHQSTNAIKTAYFHKVFPCANPQRFTRLLVRLVRDDGAVVYLNGQEIARSNMPPGEVTPLTAASFDVSGRGEGDIQILQAPANALRRGMNVLAVEVHQSSDPGPLDLSFDCELIGTTQVEPAFVIRGPYLQNGAQDAVTIRWRTDVATASAVDWGITRKLTGGSLFDPTLTTEHEVRVTGLKPGQRYFYTVGSGCGPMEGADSNHSFRTPLPVGSEKPVRIWVIGDSGTGGDGTGRAEAVRNAYLRTAGRRPTDVWLMLGDNAYDIGLDSEYQGAVFETYRRILPKTLLWPAIGNHETYAGPTVPYFDIFTLPTEGEGGGLPSGTERYYSFDYGQVHFVCLDSMTSDRSPAGAMLTWLEQDLSNTTQPWIIAYWHHPPYSHGSHNSDSETELLEMRQNALPILEAHGVDLILGGHSHSYERSFLIKGHYGTSQEVTSGMFRDFGNGRPHGDGAYEKVGGEGGAVYTVCGVSGKVSGGTFDYPVMYTSLATLGSMSIEVSGSRLDARFIDAGGVVRDSFRIQKR